MPRVVPIFKSYRFIVGACATIMLILLIRSSAVSDTITLAKTVTSSVYRPSPGIKNGHVSPAAEGAIAQEIEVPTILSLPQGDAAKHGSESVYFSEELVDESAVQGANKLKSSEEKCNKDHQYVVMIDAGSTGSRVHIYEFDVCFQPPKLIKETFDMLKPGLSSFEDDTIGAAKSLDPLLERALSVVPAKKRGCTPVAVKATAGLRLLGEAKSANILAAVRRHLENDYPFAVVEGDGISIMSGDEEGVYAWITTNYLLGNIGGKTKMPTSGIFDLGGASTQIVFEPTLLPREDMVEGEHKYELTFGGFKYTLYQYSHLGYGLMQGRNKINSVLVENAIKSGKIKKGNVTSAHRLSSPCLPPNVEAPGTKVKLSDGETYVVDFHGPKVPAGAQCRFLADKILNKDAQCNQPPCSFNGVHQPSLVRTFESSSDLYVFSYFYDRTHLLGLPLSFTLGELFELSRTVCNGEEVWESVFSGIDGSISELQNDPNFCLDLSFQVSLLHTGYDIPLHRELRTAQTIANNEIGWCLGASLPLLNSDNWKCRISEVEKS